MSKNEKNTNTTVTENAAPKTTVTELASAVAPTPAVTNAPIDLSSFITAPKSKKVKGESTRELNTTAFSQMDQSSINFFEYIGFDKLKRNFDANSKKFYLSTTDIKDAPYAELEKIVAGAPSVQKVYTFEGPDAERIYKDFYSSAAPKTKAHTFGFGVKDGIVMFIAQQGCSVKPIVICQA